MHQTKICEVDFLREGLSESFFSELSSKVSPTKPPHCLQWLPVPPHVLSLGLSCPVVPFTFTHSRCSIAIIWTLGFLPLKPQPLLRPVPFHLFRPPAVTSSFIQYPSWRNLTSSASCVHTGAHTLRHVPCADSRRCHFTPANTPEDSAYMPGVWQARQPLTMAFLSWLFKISSC